MSAPDDVSAERYDTCMKCPNAKKGMGGYECWNQPSFGGYVMPQKIQPYWFADRPQCPAGRWAR